MPIAALVSRAASNGRKAYMGCGDPSTIVLVRRVSGA
jgi:hypothetical protein